MRHGLLLLTCASLAACAPEGVPLTPSPKDLARAAPDSFEVLLETTRGPVTMRYHREWSPLGVDRIHYLVGRGFYDGAYFFRAVPGFVVQFGLPGRPPLDSAWNTRAITDEPVRASNTRGMIAFARGGPDTRSIQLYVNLANNARLDTLNTFGFPPVGRVVSGMDVMDSVFTGYSQRGMAGPSQDSIRVAGNAYLERNFPRLDRIFTARVTRAWQAGRQTTP